LAVAVVISDPRARSSRSLGRGWPPETGRYAISAGIVVSFS